MEKEISRATLKRLPTYLAYLKAMPDGSSVNISATALAAGDSSLFDGRGLQVNDGTADLRSARGRRVRRRRGSCSGTTGP